MSKNEISFEMFLVGISFGLIFWVEMPLQRLFGRGCFFLIWLVKISLQIYLDIMLALDILCSGFVTAPTTITFTKILL